MLTGGMEVITIALVWAMAGLIFVAIKKGTILMWEKLCK